MYTIYYCHKCGMKIEAESDDIKDILQEIIVSFKFFGCDKCCNNILKYINN